MCVKVDNTNQGSIYYVFLSDVLAVVEFVAFTKEAEGLCKLASEVLGSSDKLWTFPLSNFHNRLTENCNVVRLDVLHTLMVCWHAAYITFRHLLV